jgi:hypothetical protein
MAIFCCCTNTNFSLSKHIFENKKIHNTISKNGKKKLAIEILPFIFTKQVFIHFERKKSILVLVGSGTYFVNTFTHKKKKKWVIYLFTIYSQVYPINLVSSWMNVIPAWMMPLSQEERVALALIH